MVNLNIIEDKIKEEKKKKNKSPGSPHEMETEENIKKALEVGKVKKKVKKIPKKIKKIVKDLYTDPIKTTAKKIGKQVTYTPKAYKEGFKKLVSSSPKDMVNNYKTVANAIESMIPGRSDAYLKRSKGGSVRKYNSGGAAKRGYGKARR